MGQTVKRLAAVLGFIVITAFCLHKIYDVLRWKDTTGGYLSSTDQLYHTDRNLIDLALLGSSHCYYGYYPEILWEEQGIAAFDMAVSAQDVDSTYHHLKELLKTQHPRVVVVDIYGICHERHQVESNVYRNYLSMKTSANSISHVLAYTDREKQKELLFRWPVIHTRYRELKAFDFVPYEPSVIGRGSLITWQTTAVKETNGINLCETVLPLSDRNRSWIQKLVALSEEEDFELVFSLILWERGDDIQAILNGFKEYIRETNIDFIDFTELAGELGIDPATDWADAEHLNARGAGKITRYLGDYLAANYDLPDRRGDERYRQWDEALSRYHQIEQLDQLNHTDNDEAYFTILSGMPKLTCIISLEGDYPESLYAYASLFRMTYDDYLAGGKWLYRDGQLTKLCENTPGSEAVCDLNEIDSLKVCCPGNPSDCSIRVGGISYVSAQNGLWILTYDELEKKVLFSRALY